ncbi:MAG: CaiB/BaiF CoA transferase family protein [Acidimicrobiales bacterium]
MDTTAHGSSQPLEGIRVVDAGTRIGAPFCAGLLGEWGAEVIKVEQPRSGDFMRHIGPFAIDRAASSDIDMSSDIGMSGTAGASGTGGGDDGYSLFWAVEGRGRKSVTCDLHSAAGQDLFRRLASKADVVCENFRPGTMEAWGIGPGALDPRLVFVRISAFGQDGPYSARPGLDRLGVAYGGLMHLTGEPGRPPVRPGVTVSDYLTGVFAAEAALAALYRRDRRGGRHADKGAVVDASLYGSVLRILEWTIAGYDRLGVVRDREGNRLANSAPLDNYPTSDGRSVCIVAGSDANFRRLCAAMHRQELAADPRFSNLAQRARNGDLINAIVAGWTSSLTADEIELACIAHDVPVATAYTARDIATDRHFEARGDLVRVADPVLGPLLQQAPYPRLDGKRPEAPRGAPLLGADNEEIWGGLLGVSKRQLAELTAKGVL